MTNSLNGASVLVTGASGFIGAHLVARLIAEGATVCALVQRGRRNTRLKTLGIEHCAVVADLEDAHSLSELLGHHAPDYIFHLSAERDITKLTACPDRSANISTALMRATASTKLKRFVTIGSSLEIPDPTTGLPCGPHGVAKARSMQAMQALSTQNDIPFSALRTHYVYGPLHGPNKLIPVAIRAAATGVPMSVTDAAIQKRFVYVLDIVDACLQVLNMPADPNKVYLATAEVQYSNESVISRIGQLMGKEIRVKSNAFPARAWDRANWDLPVETVNFLPGWSANTNLDQGLRATIAAEMHDAII